MMNIDSNFIIICPACGYSFKKPDMGAKKKRLTCPMCRYIFKNPDEMPSKFDDFTI
ncbi:MAG: hypothetical protein ACTSO6_15175 [Promethearchaeota archaeon]